MTPGDDYALVIGGGGLVGGELLDQEASSLRMAGAKVLVIAPDEASSSAIGPDPFDVANLDSALIAGRRQAHQRPKSASPEHESPLSRRTFPTQRAGSLLH